MDPAQLNRFNQALMQSIGQSSSDLAELQKHQQAIPRNPHVAAALNAKTFDEFWDSFKEAPLAFIANTGVESLPAMAPGLVLGGVGGMVLKGGTAGFAAGMGAGSYGVDYPLSVVEALRANGGDATAPGAPQTAPS